MNFYFAPLEGITGYLYRNAYHTYFHPMDKYFSPFISTNQNGKLSNKELNDILPEHNKGMILVPQLLSNNATHFIQTSKEIKQLGYNELNLNLGCPSGTVVSKGKGSGFLAKKEELNAFLEEIFTASITKISVKTRIGKVSPDEFYDLIEIYNQYPMEELIIHPRIQTDFYKNKPNHDIFREAMVLSKNPVCYNGDIFSRDGYNAFSNQFQSVDTIMLGRGMLTNPGLVSAITKDSKLDKTVLKEFHDRIYQDYKGQLFGDRNVLFKMKELWFYMIQMFSNHEKYFKKIKKSERLCDYDDIVTKLFHEQEIIQSKEYSK